MTSLPAAASNSDCRRPFSSRLSRDTYLPRQRADLVADLSHRTRKSPARGGASWNAWSAGTPCMIVRAPRACPGHRRCGRSSKRKGPALETEPVGMGRKRAKANAHRQMLSRGAGLRLYLTRPQTALIPTNVDNRKPARGAAVHSRLASRSDAVHDDGTRLLIRNVAGVGTRRPGDYTARRHQCW
jgi:hypothetical protein